MTDYPEISTKTKEHKKIAPMKVGKKQIQMKVFKAEMQRYNDLPHPLTQITKRKFFIKYFRK